MIIDISSNLKLFNQMKLENCELDKALIDTKYNFLNCKVTTIKAIQHKIMTG